MKLVMITLCLGLISLSAIAQQRTCETRRVEGTDPIYDRLCTTKWDVSYDFTTCKIYNGADGHLELFFGMDNGVATDLETGETYLIKVHSGANLNPGPGSVNQDGGTFHWAGTVAGKIVVQLVIHVNFDGNNIKHEVRKYHVRCL